MRVLAILALAPAVIGVEAAAAGPVRPNIVVILADDLGYADIGVHGLEDVPTPHIDSLAVHGVRCTSGYVSGPYCSPTRAGLLTGRYQQRFGHEFNPHRGDPNVLGLPLTATTIADRLRAGGYATGVIGKWHLGVVERFHPLRRGFDEFYGFIGGARSYFPIPGKAAAPPADLVTERTFRAPLERHGKPVEWEGYLTDALGHEAASFVSRHRQRPFFLYLAFNAVHSPLEVTDRYLARVRHIADPRRRTYCAMLSAMDDAVGLLLAELRASGLEERTLVFFLSDNGGPIGKNGSSNAPFRGSKRETWEGGVRVPFLVRWKGRLPAGRVYDEPVIQLDILPTALAAAGFDVSPEWQLDGVNLLPFLGSDATGPPHPTLHWRMGEDNWAIRHGRWKVVQTYGSGEPQLFDLARDPGESNDLRGAHPEKFRELKELWQAWNRQLPPPAWLDPDPYGGRKTSNPRTGRRS